MKDKVLVTWNTIKEFNDDGSLKTDLIIDFDESVMAKDSEVHAEGTCWFPLLGRYLPEDMTDIPMLVSKEDVKWLSR